MFKRYQSNSCKWSYIYAIIYHFKMWGSVRFFTFLKVIKNTVKQYYCEILLQVENIFFHLKYIFKSNILYSDSKLNYSSLQCFFRNHSNIIICCPETVIIIISVETAFAASYFCGKL